MTLEIITSDSLLPLRHGFFTRRGGASSGIFSGLNCGFGSTDQSEIVSINRGRVADAMGVDRLITLHQIHSADVVSLTDLSQAEDLPKADGIVTNLRGIALGVLAADCQPVLFADAAAGVIGATHAGWRGALTGALDNTVEAMIALGAERSRIRAVIGPCISQRAYEVGPEFFDGFMAETPENAQFFAGGGGDRLHFDLAGFGLHRLRRAGVEAEWTGHCTYSDPKRFYSYRRATHEKEADYGRLISAIRM